MTTGLRFFYRHIHVTSLENIPEKGPVIIIANHPSSVMDAAVLGILLKRPIHFFTRGDVFVNKPVQKILSWLHMMPVHTHDAGRHTLGVNADSFSGAQRILTKGGIIVFFPESTSHAEHQLLPFRKGVFRLAFQTAEANNFSFEITIVPIGITYDHPVAARKHVQVHAGKPILISTYRESYLQNAPATLLRISKTSYDLAYKKVLHIDDKTRLATAKQSLTIFRNSYATDKLQWKIASGKRLEQEQTICTRINEGTQQELEMIAKQQEDYFNRLNSYGLTDKTIAAAPSFPLWKKTMLWLFLPVYITGAVLNGLPVLIARRLADKKVRRIDFYSWIFVAGYVLLYTVWLIAAGVTTAIVTGWQYLLIVLPVMAITGLISYCYIDCFKEYRQYQQLNRLSPDQRTALKKLRDQARIL